MARLSWPMWTSVFGLYPRMFTFLGYSAPPSSAITSFEGRYEGPGRPVRAMKASMYTSQVFTSADNAVSVMLLVIPTMSTS